MFPCMHLQRIEDPATCFSFQKNRRKLIRIFDPETVFYVVHKLCVSLLFVFVSVALFIVCKITQSCIVYV